MLLQHEEAGQSADTIVAAIMHKLDAMLKHMVHMANVVQEAVNDTRKATDHLYRTGEEMRMTAEGDGGSEEDIQRTTDEFRDEVSKLTVAAAQLQRGPSGALAQCQDVSLDVPPMLSLEQQLPATHLSMLTRMQIKEKTGIIDKDLSAETNQLSDLTEFKLWPGQ